MKNEELADIFNEIADLMEIQGEQPFRIASYRKVARILEELTEDVETLLADGRLAKIPGIGKGSLERIEEYLKTGKISTHQELVKKVPKGLLKLTKVPGLGPKTIALLWKEMDITDIGQLRKAINSGMIEKLPGMGAKKVEKISKGIDFVIRSSGRIPLGIALPIAEELITQIKKIAGVKKAEIAGSLRRRAETIGDIDILTEASDGQKVLEKFTKFRQVREVLASGSTKASVRIQDNIQVDVRVIPAESFGAAWQYFTGSKAHNVRLRKIAIEKKLKLNEYGLFENEKQIAGANEEEIYHKLSLPYIPPELREDRGEIENADKLPTLIDRKDIKGDLHMHTTASDGHNSPEEMIRACIERGYEYMCITDHSKSSAIAGGLDETRLRKHIAAVRKLAEKYKNEIAVLIGSEVDILADGQLDYDDGLLAELDFVIASVHSALSQPADKITKRVLKVMENPYVRLIGHPTGRLLAQREASAIDVAKIIKQAKDTDTWLELNSSWQRLDLKDVHLRLAKQEGVKICICTDAHSIDQLDYIQYGIYTARRGWLEKEDVINTLSRKKFMELVKQRKR